MVRWVVLAALSAVLLAFSQTLAWYGDEGFHLLAAQLIIAGKKPYVDFFYPQAPLYAYLNAGWMWLFGEGWRGPHLLSALCTSACAMLSAGFVFDRLPDRRWAGMGAMLVASFICLHSQVMRFGTIGQAYGICLLLILVSFRLTLKAVDHAGNSRAFWAGLCAGAAAECSLLSAAAGPILLIWMARHNYTGDRLRKCGWFVGGAAASLVPVIVLLAQAPRQTLFNVLEYALFHRSPGFIAAARSNIQVLTGWLDSGQGLLVALLGATGLLFVLGRSEWDARRKAEFSLCGWLVAGLGLHLATPQPTYPQYFVLLIPFASILASVGVHAIGSRLSAPKAVRWLAFALLGVLAVQAGRFVNEQRSQLRWPYLEQVATELNQVTPRDGLVWADEMIYVASRRLPPPGLEHFDAQRLQLSPALAASLHVVPRSQVLDWLASGRFATVASCWATDKWVESSGILKIYTKRKTVHGCDIFWHTTPR